MTDENETGPGGFRRGGRLRKASLKAQESLLSHKVAKGLLVESEESFEEFEEVCEKPKVLHGNDAVHGDRIFAFPTPKRRGAVIKKAAETPHAARKAMKKNIAAAIVNDSEDSDFSASCSEYEQSQSSSSSEDEDDEDEDKNQSSPDKTKQQKCESSSDDDDDDNNKRRNTRPVRRKTKNYTIKTDDYFTQHSSKKILTSNHTLDRLETPRLPQDQLHKLLVNLNLSVQHKIALKSVRKANQANFDKWICLLHENFNVVVHGLGSKMKLLNKFHDKLMETGQHTVIVVNGFFPSLTIKDLLDGIAVDLLEHKEVPVNPFEACDAIEEDFAAVPDQHLYVIVHNIDMIKGAKAQGVLARLAAVKNIHLVASVDHINVPLIWDQSKLSKFNFTWWNVTSFEPYIDETSFEGSLLVQNSGVLAISSLQNIFVSLTSNSKRIYLILVKYQLENGQKQYYQGLPFKDLYSMCREAFLVSSDLALRAQLTEFLDHKIVKTKRSADGTEHLQIPIANKLLQEFLNEQS